MAGGAQGGTSRFFNTGLERDGALAEIGFRLSLEPVWPSRPRHEIHEIGVRTERTLRFADIASLAAFGIDAAGYESLDYRATQALSAAAHFLEFDGLIVPSARHNSSNLFVFMDRDPAKTSEIKQTEAVDWAAWRKRRG